jgi:hypothetical protein
MSNPTKEFGRQLTALEPVSSTVRQRYERRLQDILEERLSAAVRALCLTAASALFLFAAGAAYVVLLDREAYAYWPNLMLGVVVILTAVAIATGLVRVAVRGIYRRQREGRWAASMCLLLLATWGLFMLLAAYGLPDSLRQVFLTLGLVCLGAAAFVAQRLSAARAQLALDKRLLEIEYSLAEISERLDR